MSWECLIKAHPQIQTQVLAHQIALIPVKRLQKEFTDEGTLMDKQHMDYQHQVRPLHMSFTYPEGTITRQQIITFMKWAITMACMVGANNIKFEL